MKRTLLFIACVLASVTMPAQEEPNEYLPFVKKGKQWHMVQSTSERYRSMNYMLMNEEVVKAGKTYMKMYRTEDVLAAVYDAGLFREENRKVYIFDTDMQEEILMFDYSMKAGDTYETYSYDELKMVSYRVLSVGDYREGPDIICNDYDEKADSTVTERRYLRKWVVCRTDDESRQKTWIEGVGSLDGPLANLYDERPVSSRNYLAYVNDADEYETFLPFSFYDVYSQIHGCNLPTGAEDDWEGDERHRLTYELEGNYLHVYGKAFTQCGPNNYAYFIEERTDDPLVRKLHFVIQEVEPLADCMALHATNFHVPGFDPNMNYIVVDNQGEEHPVINKTPQMAYRPFVEDGKVWKVGALNSGNPVQWVEYYYFDGDTIIEGKTCKQMMRQQYVSPDFAEYDIVSLMAPLYEGAWYEEDKKVYLYDPTTKEFKLMYDFSLDANDTLQINNQLYIIGPRQTGGIKGFKGVYRDIRNHMAWKTTWLEGVGGLDGPTINVYPGQGDPAWFLMSCTAGDEVIYLNDDYEDGATPEVMKAPKRRFDFTHTTKTKPKTPKRSAEASEMQSLYGDYNDLQLGINLRPLDDTYLVRITNESGKAVYEKAINAGHIVGLDIDISTYTKGHYTVIVENSSECFTGHFETQTTGIEKFDFTPALAEGKEVIYNLQGQRISSLQKGLNIVNGQKVYVK